MTLIVMDFDGPLFDGRAAMYEALQKTWAELQSQLKSVALPPKSTLPLLPPAPLIGLICSELPDADRKTVTQTYQRRLSEIEKAQSLPEEVHSTLTGLFKQGCKLALFSGRSPEGLKELMNRLGIAPMFIKPLDGSAMIAKPSGDYLRKLRETVGAAAQPMIMVGDSDLDYLAAVDANVSYYHADWTGEPCSDAARKAALKLGSIAELASIFIRTATPTEATDEQELYDAMNEGEFCFYAGAGISVPSGIGDWQRHYKPVLEQLGASYLCKDSNLIEVLQLLCADPLRAKSVFESFRTSFEELKSPNAYHYALLRANPVRIWTSNYDSLFERAIDQCGFKRRVVNKDSELLDYFGNSTLVKMNGDFVTAEFDVNLDWNVVFLQEQFDRAEVQRSEIWRLFEDDYRNRTLVFVGVSFTDPALRRVVSIARRKIKRTRYTHFLLQKRLDDPAARNQQAMFAKNLRRSNIVTIFKDTHEEIEALVRRLAVRSNRPIVGFSGNGGRVSADEITDEKVADGMSMNCGNITRVCSELGKALARQGYRISSGCAQFVGIPAVEAAFNLDPTRARFYLRRNGGRMYQRTAPAIVVGGSNYEDMRARFIPELSCLIGIGGQTHDEGKSGTIAEIGMALDRGIPILLLPQAGGNVAENWTALRERMRNAYRDTRLASAVGEINDRVKALSASDLVNGASTDIQEWINDLVGISMGAETRDSDGPAFRERQRW